MSISEQIDAKVKRLLRGVFEEKDKLIEECFPRSFITKHPSDFLLVTAPDGKENYQYKGETYLQISMPDPKVTRRGNKIFVETSVGHKVFFSEEKFQKIIKEG